ncbi:UDP-glucose 4-epimerase GalE [Agrobacterium leguminum]|uniref:UDP-glucose 4-epimerase n=1 Tax=Agrobacterium deltaense NCPPB 1641 TaxID=1183425 RepID=A0A1S7TRY7_9HYPH|nr:MULTISPECIES: UDP-glucose 4-epimerase GalE [Agrobacterium]WFS69305.1 UDP-glucose 4-epimerase GalE [Agrobacterium leguminum]CVI57348.1 UDP-glucose 4-epimerase (UDP-galactose 4-epimerase) (Galactowaldenase) [Agrobacterium deltaense NCPPB 1641]
MTVLVTGGAGYIGSHMVLELVGSNERVVVLDWRSPTCAQRVVSPLTTYVVGDVGNQELVGTIIVENQIDAIIHFAGSTVVRESVSDPLSYYENNTVKTGKLIKSAVDGRVAHFVFSSTAAVYGATGPEPVTEDSPLNPQSPYGRSKLMSEWMLYDAAAAHGLTYAVLRYFNVAGADPEGRAGPSMREATHLIKVACETAMGKRPFMNIYGDDYPTNDGTCVRDYIHVSDLVEAHRLALDRLRKGGESITANCGYGRGYSVLEVLNAVRQAHGAHFDARVSARRIGDISAIVANTERVRRELGWRPKRDDLNFIVADALAWEKTLTSGRNPNLG